MGVNGKNRYCGYRVLCTIGEAMVEFERLVFLGADITPIISNNVATIDSRFGRAEESRNSLELISGKNVSILFPTLNPSVLKDCSIWSWLLLHGKHIGKDSRRYYRYQ